MIESSSLDTAARLFWILTRFHASLHQRRSGSNRRMAEDQSLKFETTHFAPPIENPTILQPSPSAPSKNQHPLFHDPSKGVVAPSPLLNPSQQNPRGLILLSFPHTITK